MGINISQQQLVGGSRKTFSIAQTWDDDDDDDDGDDGDDHNPN